MILETDELLFKFIAIFRRIDENLKNLNERVKKVEEKLRKKKKKK